MGPSYIKLSLKNLMWNLTNQDSFVCPKGVRNREVPLYNEDVS